MRGRHGDRVCGSSWKSEQLLCRKRGREFPERLSAAGFADPGRVRPDLQVLGFARRSSRDRRRLAIELALAEHLTLFSTGTLVDRYHPARGEPGVQHVFSAPAFAQATVRHAIFGVVLGRLGTQNDAPGPG